MKRLLIAGVVSAGLLLGVGATAANAQVWFFPNTTVFTVSVNKSFVNGVTTIHSCSIVNIKNGQELNTFTPAQMRQLARKGITNPTAQCTINGDPPTPV
ncbi:MAG: hypothetical protein AB7R89_32815 [Dehalococcoidia bacterium]